jgi:ParB family transcriptional regulator, chromosome partitioning protein
MPTVATPRPVGRPRLFDRPLSNAQKQARHRARVKAQLQELEQLRQNKKPQGTFQSKSQEWFTPPELLEKVRSVLRTIDLDPASCAQANENVKAKRFYDKRANGLSRSWCGRVFLNPPYGKLCRPFFEKLLEQYEAGNVTEAIAILSLGAMDRKWMKPILDIATVCIISGRVRFISPNPRKKQQPTNGSIALFLGSNPARFRRVFSKIGTILQ